METFYSLIAIPILLVAAVVCIFQWVGYSIVEASGYPFDDQYEIITPSDIYITDSNEYVYYTDKGGNLTCFYVNELEYLNKRKHSPAINMKAGDTIPVIGQSREVTSAGIFQHSLNNLVTIETENIGAITIKFSNHLSNVELSDEEKLLNLHICERH